MGEGFQAELYFSPAQSTQAKPSELAAFLDLSEHCLRFYRAVAPMPQALFACQKISCNGFIFIECVIDLYLPVAF